MKTSSGAEIENSTRGPAEAAAYIADMSAVLRNMALDAKLEFLAYLLGMVHEESSSHSESSQMPRLQRGAPLEKRD